MFLFGVNFECYFEKYVVFWGKIGVYVCFEKLVVLVDCVIFFDCYC